MLEADRQAAWERLLLIQRLLTEEQRDLRFFIQEVKPAPLGLPGADSGLAVHLKELRADRASLGVTGRASGGAG